MNGPSTPQRAHVPPDKIPAGTEARAGLYRSLLHERRMLVLLDNAATAAQVRPLLPSSTSCLVLVTSRNRLDELVMSEGATRIGLEVLSTPEAHDLFTRYLGQARVEAEPEAVDALIDCCAGLPLALGIVAVRAGENPDFPLDELVAELRDERERLSAFDTGGTGVRAVFSWSYRALSSEAARVFRLLGLPTGPDIGLDAAAALVGESRPSVRRLLGELTRAHLVEQYAPGRYRLHDLLRAYAAECAGADETAAGRAAAVRRLADSYLRTSRGIERQLTEHSRLFVPEPPDSDISPKVFADGQDGLAWWDLERRNLLAVTEQTAALGLHEHAWQIPYTLMHFFNLRRHTEDWIASSATAISSARALGDRQAEAHLREDLAGVYYSLQRYRDAVREREAALELFDADAPFLGMVLISHAYCFLRLGEYDVAESPLRRGLELRESAGDSNGCGYAHAGFGLLHAGRGQLDEAVGHFEEALGLYRQVGETFGEGFVLNNLADAYIHADHFADAARTYRQAVEHRQDIGHRHGEATSLRGLGAALRASGDSGGARDAWQQALGVLEELGDPEAEAVRSALAELPA